MKNLEKISENKNYTAVNVGTLDDIKSYSLTHGKLGIEIVGKVFLQKATNATGTEISYTVIPPKKELGYFHIHNKDEETYIILKGEGFYQVDDDCFPICEGSVIRVAPEGVRGIRNSSDEEMIYLCVQSKMNSLEEHTYDDGQRVEHNSKLS